MIRGGAAIFYAGIDNSDTMWDGPQAGLSTEGSWTENGLGTVPAFILSQGFPAAPSAPLNNSFGAVPIGQEPVFSPEFWVQDRPVIYSEQWNLGVERQLGSKTLLQVGYMGMVGRHLANEPMNYNQVASNLMGPGNAQVRRPFPQFGNVDGFSANDESSLYHALLLSVRRHYSNGLSFTANYTRSVLDSDYSFKRSDYNRQADYGPDAVSMPNNFIFSSVYHLPFGGSPGARFLTSGVGSRILGGWLLGAMVPIQTALPAYFGTASDTCNCYTIGTQSVNITGPVRYTPNFNVAVDPWFETSNISAASPYTFGNAGANDAVRGPMYWAVDLNLTRRFRITERYALEFRMDAFNLTNNVIFTAPNMTFGSPGFGMITSADPGRILQYAAKLIF